MSKIIFEWNSQVMFTRIGSVVAKKGGEEIAAKVAVQSAKSAARHLIPIVST
jgi:hypothetical protein